MGTGAAITRLKEMERQSHAMRDRLELAVLGSKACTWDFELGDGTIENSRATYTNVWEVLGYEVAEDPDFFAGGLAVLIHPEDQRQFVAGVQSFLDGTGLEWEDEYRVRHRDGSDRWHLSRGIVTRDAKTGRALRLTGTSVDVTDLKRAIAQRMALEGELKAANDRLELGVRGSNVAIFDFDMPDGRIENSKQTMINVWETLGYDPASVPPDFLSGAVLAVHPEDLGLVHGAIGAYLAGATPEFEVEYRVRHKSGNVQWRIGRGTAIRDVDGKAIRFAGSFIDVTDKKIAEGRLTESERRWRNLADSLPQLVWTATADGTFDYFSAQTEAYAGLSERELLDGAWRETTHPEDRERTEEAWAGAVARQRDHEVEHRIRRWDGAYRWFTRRALPVRDDVGRVVKWFGTCTDITRGKELEEELRHAKERLEVAIRGSNLSIWEFDMPDGPLAASRVTLTNFWESLGYGSRVDDYADLERLIHPEDLGLLNGQIQAYLAGEASAFETEHRILHENGTYRWLLARGTAMRDATGAIVRFVGTSVDITDIKKIEAELQRARLASESANRAKDEFLANVSHEIRTPMNAILGVTELALDSARTDHQRRLLTTVKSAARNLLGIINDLLDFSKIAAGRLVLDRADFSLRAEVGDTLRALAARAHRKGLELICQVHPDVPDGLEGDAGRLRQVLMNLVANAIKFTAQGEVLVEVTASVTSNDAVSLLFTVRDTGIGIAPDKQAAIFRAFEQEDSSTTRKYGGTGLGLTISAQIAALMGGTITVESEPGRGSTFGFRARFTRAPRPAKATARTAELLEGLRVLVMDDNETNAHVLVEWLTNWRMRPTAVADAISAFEALGRGEESGDPYLLVLLDGRMPDVDGVTMAGRIHDRFGAASKRLIVLSSDDSPALVSRSRAAGVRACLLKPVQQSELLETIWAVMHTVDSAPDLADIASDDGALTATKRTALRILVAEDNELNVALLQELFRQDGHRAQFASDGRSALALAIEGVFDLLLLDLHMPEMDGFEVVKAIRGHEATTGTHLPIIALTARSSNRDREKCLAAGMDEFLSKPIESDTLWGAIDGVVAAFPREPKRERESWLLDPRAVLRACGGQAAVLERVLEVFRRTLPEHIDRVRAALRDRDLPRLREAAHLLHGTLATFSTIAGAVATTLEDAAVRGEVENCEELVHRLDAMCAELLEDTRTLTFHRLGL